MQLISTFSKKDRHVFNWLITGGVMIVLMVVIGGVTRLTQSGLSMVKWEPIMGTIPPLNEAAWNEMFDLYKQSPEFHHFNSNFSLDDFKGIYFWEYLHRLIGRVLGLVFLFPCIFFLIKGYFREELKKHVLLIFIWGAFQGVLGWIMVKSGLIDQPHVSHYRLAAHLVTALGLMSYIFWIALSLKYEVVSQSNNRLRILMKWFVVVLFIQIVYGAFVAGLKGGLGYNTFPKMGSQWIPSEFSNIINREGLVSLMESSGIVQFIHRIIGMVVLILTILIILLAKKVTLSAYQRLGVNTLGLIVGLQFTLGVLTLLYAVPVNLGVLHQFGAILVLLASFFFLYSLKLKSID